VTDSKLVPVEALVNRALREEAFGETEPGDAGQMMADIQRVFGKPAAAARLLIAERDLKAPKGTVDARSPATMSRAALGLLAAAPETDEEAVSRAMAKAGLTKEMIPQLMESPDWASTVARLCQQYLFVTGLPKMISAQITKASLGDTTAFKALLEAFGKGEHEHLDEQTKALAHAAPETVIRSIDAQIEHLGAIRADLARSAVDAAKVSKAKAVALDDLTTRKPAR